MEYNNLKLIGLRAENIKRLTAVDINLDGDLIQITGNNGQGKTSLLDAIWWALAGSSTHQSKPIREGSEDASIRLDLGEIIVYREFHTKKDGEITTKLTLTYPDGQKITGGSQTLLDTFFSKFTFDPLEFANMESRAQYNALRKFVPEIDFDLIDAENKKDYDERTELNRNAKQSRSSALLIDVKEDADLKFVDESKLIDEMRKAGEHNASIQLRQQKRKQVSDEIAQYKKEASELIKKAEELQKELDSAEKLPELIDVSDLTKKIAKCKEDNEKLSLINKKKLHNDNAKKIEDKADEITKRIEKRNEDKLKAISKAKLPVKELSFGDGIILFKGVPFEQASDAERLKVSMAIAMANNQKLRLLRVRQGSLLDEKSKEAILRMAKENKYQIIMETVGNNTSIGVIIEMEDGKVKVNKKQEDF